MSLFKPLQLGAIALEHRIVMAPLTRLRSKQPGDIPQEMNAVYYGQRASKGGLLIAEATDISPSATGYPGAPGVHSADQIAGWKLVTDAVHAKGGFIFDQIWHTGRVSHSSMQPDGGAPYAPSAVRMVGKHFSRTFQYVDFEEPRVLSVEQIKQIVADFAQAAKNARAAGFDGVEIHGANGYLIDQFLRDGTNKRTDEYGGSIENRARFLLEVADAVIAAIGNDRVGVRLSPWGQFNEVSDSDNESLFKHVIAQLDKRNLAYLHIIEPRADQSTEGYGNNKEGAVGAVKTFRPLYRGPIIAAGGFLKESAQHAIDNGEADAVAFGRPFLANPDLPERFAKDLPLNKYDRATFYGGNENGYTTYPVFAESGLSASSSTSA